MQAIRQFKLAIVVALIMSVATIGIASAQTGYETRFTTSITLQNLSSTATTVTFNFYAEGDGTPIAYDFELAGNAGGSVFLGNPDTNVPGNFSGSATLSASQPIAATAVQVPAAGSEVRNRPLSNGFSSGQASSSVLLATVLKNQFGVTSKFSVQNADSQAVNIELSFYNADNPAAAPIVVTESNIPPGAAKYYDMGTLANIGAASFNGSAIVTAQRSDSTAGNIVASVTELGVSGSNRLLAAAFEGVNNGGTTIYMATALCDVFGGATTAYAVQNVDRDNAANITVTFQPGGQTRNVTVQPGAKASIVACDTVAAGFTGAATVSSDREIIVIGKVFGAGLGTAFLGETDGTSNLSLPYVRFATDARYQSGEYQRGNIAIQNVGAIAVSNVQVRYLDKNGGLVGTHTIPTIEAGAKANSNALQLCPTPGSQAGCSDNITLFGNPEAQPDGVGFGGAVQIVGPAGSQLIAIVRIESNPPGVRVGEDYNGIPIQ